MKFKREKEYKRYRRHLRVRRKIIGDAERPRLCVFRSLRHIYVQAIDDERGATLAQASTRDLQLRGESGSGGNRDAAQKVGQAIAEKLKSAGVETVVFDRGGFLYHGRVRALAEAAREGGLKF